MSGARGARALLAGAAAVIGLVAGIGTILFLRIMYPPPPHPRPDRIRIAAIGDSNTYGAGVLLLGRHRRSYPAQLGRILGERHQVLNYGVNRCTLQQEGDWPWDATPFADASLRARPDVVLIMLGSNDARGDNWNAERYESELTDFVERYRAHGAEVHLLTPPVAFANRGGVSARLIEEEVVPIVRRVADALGVDLIDVFDATARAITSHPDGIHLDARASLLVAETVADALR